MKNIKIINGISYIRKKVKGMSCAGCILQNPDKSCKIHISVHRKCVDSGNYEVTYIFVGILNPFNKIKLV